MKKRVAGSFERKKVLLYCIKQCPINFDLSFLELPYLAYMYLNIILKVLLCLCERYLGKSIRKSKILILVDYIKLNI